MLQPIQTLPNIASVRDIQRHYKSLFDNVKRNKQPLYLLANNKPQVVVLDVSFFENIIKKMQVLEEARVLGVVREGLTEYKQGKTKILKSLKSLV